MDLERGIVDPLGLIDEIFQSSSEKKLDNSDFGEHEVFEKILLDPILSSRIPFLTRAAMINGSIIPNSLIRYRGLVQDVYNKEFYVGVAVETNRITNRKRYLSTKYRDSIDNVNDDIDVNFDKSAKTMERLSLFLVPTPGESDWVKDHDSSFVPFMNSSCYSPGSANSCHSNSRKRSMSQQDSSDIKENNAELPGDTIRKKSGNTSSSSMPFTFPSSTFISNEETEICCLTKMYDCDDDHFRLNDMIEVVGVYSLDYSVVAGLPDENSIEYLLDPTLGLEQADDTLPPTSVAPRLHCISFRRIGSSFPLLQEIESQKIWGTIPCGRGVYACVASSESHSASQMPKDLIQLARLNLLTFLTSLMYGDSVAAEYLLLALLSRVVGRTESVILGCFPLVISGFNKSDEKVRSLKYLLSHVVPRCVRIEADINALNKVTVQPAKDHEQNRISPSPLQVGAGTIILVDETGLEEGNLTDNGVRSAYALRSVALNQMLPIAFTYCEIQVPTDVPLLFLTSSINSSLHAMQDSVRVHIFQSSDSSPYENNEKTRMLIENTEDAAPWHDLRKWWALMRMQEVTMDAEMVKAAEDDFVNARQHDTSLTPSDFHIWLTIARLLAISHGEVKITHKVWANMKALEESRKSSILISKTH